MPPTSDMKKTAVYIRTLAIALVLFMLSLQKTLAQNCVIAGNLVSGKGIPMFMKSINNNRIITGGVYYTSSQSYFTILGDTLRPRAGDMLTVFAAVLDSNLALIRAFNVIGFKSAGGAFNDTRLWDMHADVAGNIYFCGSYSQDSLFSYFSDTIVSDGYQEGFLLRCDTLGTTTLLKTCGTRQWNTNFKFEDRIHSVCSDSEGHVYFTLSGEGFYFTINGDTANSTASFASFNTADIFIVSLNADGSTRWIRNCGTVGRDDVAYDIAANNHGEVAVCGGLNGSNSLFHFGQLSHTYKYSQYGLQGFVGKLDSSGVPLWLSPIEVYFPSGPDIGAYAAAIDDSGYVYSTGYFDAWAIFNGDTVRSLYSTSNYFSKYALNGQTQFVKLGNIDTFYPFPIYMDIKNGKTLITGQCFTNQLAFQQYGACCSTEAYAVTYTTKGEVLWVRGATAVNGSNPYFGMGCLNENGTAYVCGTGSGGTVQISPLQIPISAAKNYYIVKFGVGNQNGVGISLLNNGNDTLACGATAYITPTLTPANGPKITWWANNDTISLPNFTTNLNASPKLTTLYIATASYNGCVASDSVLLVVEPLPCFAGNDTLICAGQALALSGNTLNNAVYSWIPVSAVSSNSSSQTQFTATQNTTLIYRISRQGCVNSDTVTVLVNQLPQSSFTYFNNLLNVTFTNSALDYDSLYWDFGDTSAFSTTLNPNHTYAQNGIYTVCLHTFNSCGSDSSCQTINLSTVGINEPLSAIKIQTLEIGYRIIGTSSLRIIGLFDMSGREVFAGADFLSTNTLNLTTLQKGVYALRYSQNDIEYSLKLVW